MIKLYCIVLCLVHDQPLTDTQRMTHLQRALVGDAKRAIGGMLNHGHLYGTALLELEEQFGNEEAVAGAYLITLKSLKTTSPNYGPYTTLSTLQSRRLKVWVQERPGSHR